MAVHLGLHGDTMHMSKEPYFSHVCAPKQESENNIWKQLDFQLAGRRLLTMGITVVSITLCSQQLHAGGALPCC